jgi:hypothetical protein
MQPFPLASIRFSSIFAAVSPYRGGGLRGFSGEAEGGAQIIFYNHFPWFPPCKIVRLRYVYGWADFMKQKSLKAGIGSRRPPPHEMK